MRIAGERPPLSITSAFGLVNEAVKRATSSTPERALSELTRVMSGVLPADPCDSSLDAWARHGLMSGALAAWSGNARRMPSDLPATPAHHLHYLGAHGLALAWVASIKVSESSG